MDENKTRHRPERLRGYDYASPGYYFVTFNTKVRYEDILCSIRLPGFLPGTVGPDPQIGAFLGSCSKSGFGSASPSPEVHLLPEPLPGIVGPDPQIGAFPGSCSKSGFGSASPSPEVRLLPEPLPGTVGPDPQIGAFPGSCSKSGFWSASPSPEVHLLPEPLPGTVGPDPQIGAFPSSCSKSGFRSALPSLEVHLTTAGRTVEQLILSANQAYPNATVDCYVIMPDHVHLVVCLSLEKDAPIWGSGPTNGSGPTKPASLPQIIRAIKSMTTRKLGYRIWQDGYYDHIIRTDEELQAIRRYIQSNPQKWLETKGDEPWIL